MKGSHTGQLVCSTDTKQSALVSRSSSLALSIALTAMALAASPASAQQAPSQPGGGTQPGGPTIQPGGPATQPAPAPDNNGVADIIVTAQKRATSLQRTPISISALSGDQLRNSQVHTLKDLGATLPGLTVSDYSGAAQITIRGIGVSNTTAGGDPAVAYNVNEVYISRQYGLLGNVYDVASVEVLRGPQGTLYGRNATAGAINTTTARPDLNDWSGYVRASVGNYTAVNVEGAAGGPIVTDKVGVRLAGFVDRHDGYGTNVGTGHDIDDRNAKGVRGTLVFKPAETLTATLIGDYYHQRDHSGGSHFFDRDSVIGLPGTFPGAPTGQLSGGLVNTRIRDITGGFDPETRIETYAFTGILEWKNDSPFSLKSITGYRHLEFSGAYTIDGGSTLTGAVVQEEKDRQFSQELQAHYDTRRLHATLGGYYFHENDNAGPLFGISRNDIIATAFGLPAPTSLYLVNIAYYGGFLKTNAKAVFGQVDYELFPKLTLSAGLRYSSETKSLINYSRVDITVPFDYDPNNLLDPRVFGTVPRVDVGKATFHSTTPRFGIQYQATPATMLYATFSKGFKSGGFDPTTASPAFNPEKIDAYEGGIKTKLFNGHVQINASGFYYKYSDLQVQQVIGFNLTTQNAGKATVRGGEVQITARPAQGLIFEANAAYLDARYDTYQGVSGARPLFNGNVDFSGNRLNNAPRWTGFASLEKIWPLDAADVSLKGEVQATSRFYFTPDNVNALSQGGYAKVNAYLSYRSHHNWTAMAFVRNLTDKVTKTSANVSTFIVGAPINGSVSAPRTFGVQATYNF